MTQGIETRSEGCLNRRLPARNKERRGKSMAGTGTFRGGVHPYEGKDISKDKPLIKLYPKGDLVFPMVQHIGAPAKPIVA
ncbi:MAG: hypothetical protein IKT53_07320, partial [Bacteroidaceae bacterium]|nr:hypothetical protein [Bacteroidaceae bacterium]